MLLYEILQKRKDDLDLTYQAIANSSGIPVNNLKKIFNGYTADPQYNTLRSIVHALGMTMDDLEKIDGSDVVTPPSIVFSIAARFDRLDPVSQRVVESIISIEETRQSE